MTRRLLVSIAVGALGVAIASACLPETETTSAPPQAGDDYDCDELATCPGGGR